MFSWGKKRSGKCFCLTISDHGQRIKHQTDHVANDSHHHRSQASRVVAFHADLSLNIPQCRNTKVNSSHSADWTNNCGEREMLPASSLMTTASPWPLTFPSSKDNLCSVGAGHSGILAKTHAFQPLATALDLFMKYFSTAMLLYKSITFYRCYTLAKQTQTSAKEATTTAEKHTCHNVMSWRMSTNEDEALIYTTRSCVSWLLQPPRE